MSSYTTQLRYPIEQQQKRTGTTDYSECYKMLGLDTYPIFDENYRALLNDKIIDHFYFREIGFETMAQFRFYMRRTMNEEMPLFNQRYLSTKLEINPITNKSYTLDDMYKSLQKTLSKQDTIDTKTGTEDTKTTFDEDTTTTYNKNINELGTLDTTDTTNYGKTINDTKSYNSTEKETDNYGKKTTNTKNYGKTSTSTSQDSGTDKTREGSTHERDIHSDTPMNQISNSGVENLNYASDVTYIDKSQNSDSTTEYGKKNVTNSSTGGSDVDIEQLSGVDTKDKTKTGSETDNIKEGGSDKTTIDTDTEKNTKITGNDTTSHTGTKDAETSFNTKENIDTNLDKSIDTEGEKHDNWYGYNGISPAELLNKYRQSFLNVDMEVIRSLETLFFGLY